MTTRYLITDISYDEAPGGKAILKAYPDPVSKGPPWTIGFGSTGKDITEGTVWTEEQCLARRDLDIKTLISQFNHVPWWDHLNDVRQDVLVNMGYQMGFAGTLKFVGMLAAIAKDDFQTAAEHMRQSLWAKQTPTRAARLAEQMASGIRKPQPYDTQVQSALQARESTMSLVSDAFHFIWDHTLAAAARSAATVDPVVAQQGITAVSSLPQPSEGSANSTAGVASNLVKELEDKLNEAVVAFIKTTIDQLPAVGGVAEVTGLDQRAADAAKAMLVLGEQHALTYLSSLFSQGHTAVNAVTKEGTNAGAG